MSFSVALPDVLSGEASALTGQCRNSDNTSTHTLTRDMLVLEGKRIISKVNRLLPHSPDPRPYMNCYLRSLRLPTRVLYYSQILYQEIIYVYTRSLYFLPRCPRCILEGSVKICLILKKYRCLAFLKVKLPVFYATRRTPSNLQSILSSYRHFNNRDCQCFL